MKQVTLDDIAAQLGISKFSVSRALSGKSGVSESTRNSVLDVARSMGYRHPSLMSPGAGFTRGNIVLLIPREDVHDSEFWMEVISGAEEEAERLGFALITRPLSAEELAQRPVPAQLDGLIVAGSGARAAMDTFAASDVPMTLITYPRPLERFDTVTIGDWEGGYTVGKHLTELGHTRLAFATDRPGKPSNAERLRGFREAVEAHEGARLETLHLRLEDPGGSFEAAYRSLEKRGQGVTAVFGSTDGVAFNVIWALNRLGLGVPGDVSVVGFNDTVQASRVVPKLTTLRVPRRAIGAAAMQNLHRQISGAGAKDPPRRLSLVPEFVLRDSTAAPPAKASKGRTDD